MGVNNPFGDVKKYIVSNTLEMLIWLNTTIIRDNLIELVRALKAQPGNTLFQLSVSTARQ